MLQVIDNNHHYIINTIDKIVQFLSAVNDGPFQRKGNGLQLLHDLLQIAFASTLPEFRNKIKKCYKVRKQLYPVISMIYSCNIQVHVSEDEPIKKTIDSWLPKVPNKRTGRVISYWCFSPGFG